MKLGTARIAATVLLLGLPLASGGLAGLPAGFAELPPESVYVHPPDFSPLLYTVLTVALAGVALFLLRPRYFGFDERRRSNFTGFDWAVQRDGNGHFPGWARLGVALVALAWTAAWTRPSWLGPAMDHTFFPLWLGYILVVDGLVYRRAGTSPLARHRAGWLTWFAASAVMWWYFELLNRFVQSWLYLGVADMSAWRFALGSTLAFSTVIPAVLTTTALLGTFDHFRRGFLRGDPLTSEAPPSGVWAAAVSLGSVGLALLPWFPVALFPLIWLAPWLVVAGLLEAAGIETGLGRLLRGDWGPAVTLAVAALICGFFWELWNIHAMPKWIYQVPWLDRFKLFEMPVVGYLGYLPFGPACWAFWLLFSASARDRKT